MIGGGALYRLIVFAVPKRYTVALSRSATFHFYLSLSAAAAATLPQPSTAQGGSSSRLPATQLFLSLSLSVCSLAQTGLAGVSLLVRPTNFRSHHPLLAFASLFSDPVRLG